MFIKRLFLCLPLSYAEHIHKYAVLLLWCLLGCVLGWWRRPQSLSLCKWLWMVINVGPTYAASLMKCWESNWSSYSHTGAFLSSLRLQKATQWVGTGEARELQTILVFYHLLALVKRRVSRPCSAVSLQHVLLPLQGFLQAVSNINIHGLRYFFYSSSTFAFHLAEWNTRIPTLSPELWHFSS